MNRKDMTLLGIGIAALGIACGGIENDPRDVSSERYSDGLIASFVGEANVESGEVTLTPIEPNGGIPAYTRVYKNVTSTVGRSRSTPSGCSVGSATTDFVFELLATNVGTTTYGSVIGNIASVSSGDASTNLTNYTGLVGISPTTHGYQNHGALAVSGGNTQPYDFCVNGNFSFILQYWAN